MNKHQTLSLNALFFLLFVLSSCVSPPVEAPPSPPEPEFILAEILPNPPKVEAPPPIPIAQKKIVQGRILEITEDKGVQKFIFIKFVGVTKVPLNQEGDIFSDQSLAQKIGKFKVIEVFPDVVRAAVTDLTFKIGKTAAASYETILE